MRVRTTGLQRISTCHVRRKDEGENDLAVSNDPRMGGNPYRVVAIVVF